MINLDPYFVPSEAIVFTPEAGGGYSPVASVILYPAEGKGVHVRSAIEMIKVLKIIEQKLGVLERN